MVTNASQWKSKKKSGEHEQVLPSGNTALLRQISPEAFLENGAIPDPLSSIIMQAINSKKGLPPSKLNDIAKDPTKLAAALEMFDRALVYCVVEPAVEMPPVCIHEFDDGSKCGQLYTSGGGVHVDRKNAKYHKYLEDARDPDVLYADIVDMEDKQFIFQWSVGGVGDVKKFRDQLSDGMAAVQAEQNVGDKTE